jgi:hypothetical protein
MTVSTPVRQPHQQAQNLPPVKARRSAGERIRLIASIVVCQLLALLLVEGVLYSVGLGEEDIYKFDKQIGFMHFPSKRVTWRSEGFSQSYFDADGLRDEPNLTIAKPPGVYRIALLGDSMVEGLQVDSQLTFGKLLQARLRKDGGNVQVINFGNSGYSTAQECMLLPRKVLKYQPDLVVLGYTNRDMFENWTAPDQTLTNVRPMAVHLPGGKLVLDSSPVINWMRSPRAKWLMSISWLRQNSRIWGMISAAETQLSFQDPVYRAITAFFTRPGKTFASWIAAVKTTKWQLPSLQQLASPSYSIRFFEGGDAKNNAAIVNSSITKAPAAVPHMKLVTAPQLNGNASKTGGGEASTKSTAAGNDSKPAATAAKQAEPANGNTAYIQMLSRTMRSLLARMNADCAQNGAKFAVVFLPCRAEASPAPGLENSFFNITYSDEVRMVQQGCDTEKIPTLNGEVAIEQIPPAKRPGLFFLVHMNREGHKFFADQLYPFIRQLVPASN